MPSSAPPSLLHRPRAGERHGREAVGESDVAPPKSVGDMAAPAETDILPRDLMHRGSMTRPITLGLTTIRILYAVFWIVLAIAPLSGVPFPSQPTAAANDFWDAIAATGFMIPLIGTTYFVGGVGCLFHRATPLGLALLSAPLTVIVLFNILLVQEPGPWILIVLIHLVLLVRFRAAYVPLWSYPVSVTTTEAGGIARGQGGRVARA